MGTTLLGEERKEGADARQDGVFPVRRTEDKAPCVTRAVLTTAPEGPSNAVIAVPVIITPLQMKTTGARRRVTRHPTDGPEFRCRPI